MEKPVILQLNNVSKVYTLSKRKSFEALHELSLSVRQGEFVSLIGPSGCGKTTIIKLLAGFTEPTAGEIVGTGKAGGRQHRGVIFQHYNLFPWLTVRENIGFGLSLLDVPSTDRQETVDRHIAMMGLNGFEDAYPRELSGGMQQRVALGRAMATNPEILLMDEPFSALDAPTKRFMQDLLLRIWERETRTIVFVTHDVEETILMSDTVYVLSSRPGRIRERIEIDLPRPRDLRIFSERFAGLKKRIQDAITEEWMESMNSEGGEDKVV